MERYSKLGANFQLGNRLCVQLLAVETCYHNTVEYQSTTPAATGTRGAKCFCTSGAAPSLQRRRYHLEMPGWVTTEDAHLTHLQAAGQTMHSCCGVLSGPPTHLLHSVLLSEGRPPADRPMRVPLGCHAASAPAARCRTALCAPPTHAAQLSAAPCGAARRSTAAERHFCS